MCLSLAEPGPLPAYMNNMTVTLPWLCRCECLWRWRFKLLLVIMCMASAFCELTAGDSFRLDSNPLWSVSNDYNREVTRLPAYPCPLSYQMHFFFLREVIHHMISKLKMNNSWPVCTIQLTDDSIYYQLLCLHVLVFITLVNKLQVTAFNSKLTIILPIYWLSSSKIIFLCSTSGISAIYGRPKCSRQCLKC